MASFCAVSFSDSMKYMYVDLSTTCASELCKKCERGTSFPQHYKACIRKQHASAGALCTILGTIPDVKGLIPDEAVPVHLSKLPFGENRRQHVHWCSHDPASHQLMGEQLITDLQKQITQLVQLLEQESHKQMSIENRFQSEGKEANLVMQRKHQEDLSKIEIINANKIDELQNNFEEVLEQHQVEALKQYGELQSQFENAQAAFESYKESIIEELNESWLQKEREMKEKNEIEKKLELVLQTNLMQNKCDREKKSMGENFQQQISSMVSEHKQEMDEAAEKYNAIVDTVAELRKAKLEIKNLQDQLEKKTDELRNRTQYLSYVVSKLEFNENKLAEIETTYKTDIGNLKKKYVTSIEALVNQNIDLKQLFALKAEELCALNAAIAERERIQQLEMKASLQLTLQERARAAAAISPTTAGTMQPAPSSASHTELNKPED
uniref:flagellum-associated coiled-coil domain-containing protein 1-like n=1 Tax=Pristiophorus japonicus TaxID=55135 RepID=UPI00398F7DEA